MRLLLLTLHVLILGFTYSYSRGERVGDISFVFRWRLITYISLFILNHWWFSFFFGSMLVLVIFFLYLGMDSSLD